MTRIVNGLVSVIVPAYNAAPFIADTIESALGQTYQSLEIVVTNDGSTDSTSTVLERYRNRIKILNTTNRGVVHARNAALGEARGEFIAFLDADDLWMPEKIARQVRSLHDHPEAILIHSRASFIDANGVPVVRNDPPWQADAHGHCTGALIEHCSMTLSSVLVRRTALHDLEFRTGFYVSEDWDLWLRLSLRGPFLYDDEPLVAYRCHGNNVSGRPDTMLRSTIAVVRQFAAEHRRADLRRAARRKLRQLQIVAAHHAYEAGDFQAARRHFLSAWSGWDAPAVARLGVTLLPSSLRPRARALRRPSPPALPNPN